MAHLVDSDVGRYWWISIVGFVIQSFGGHTTSDMQPSTMPAMARIPANSRVRCGAGRRACCLPPAQRAPSLTLSTPTPAPGRRNHFRLERAEHGEQENQRHALVSSAWFPFSVSHDGPCRLRCRPCTSHITVAPLSSAAGKPQALRFKAGSGRVIRGWDHALLTMCKGERAELQIEVGARVGRGRRRRRRDVNFTPVPLSSALNPSFSCFLLGPQPEWAYGSKGLPEAGIPKNAKLIFEVELVSIGV